METKRVPKKKIQHGDVAPNEEKEKTTWTAKLVTILLEEYIEQLKKSFTEGGINKAAWNAATAEFNKRTADMKTGEFVKDVLQSKINSLKKDYAIFSQLEDESGFGIEEDGTITAEPRVWDAYLESHKNAKKFRGKPLPDYQLMCEAFSGRIATGKYAQNTASGPSGTSGVAAAASDGDDDDGGNNDGAQGEAHKGDDRIPAPPGASNKGGEAKRPKIEITKPPVKNPSDKGAAVQAMSAMSVAFKTFAENSKPKDYSALALSKFSEWNGNRDEVDRLIGRDNLKVMRYLVVIDNAKLFLSITDDTTISVFVDDILLE